MPGPGDRSLGLFELLLYWADKKKILLKNNMSATIWIIVSYKVFIAKLDKL